MLTTDACKALVSYGKGCPMFPFQMGGHDQDQDLNNDGKKDKDSKKADKAATKEKPAAKDKPAA